MKEKRRFTRREISLDVLYDVSSELKGIGSWTKDISAGGICVISKAALTVDKIMDFEFTIPEMEKKLKASGKVVWVEKVADSKKGSYYNGIEFINLDPVDKDLIAKFVDGATFHGEWI